ncbi:MAG: TIGR02449 family protein [Gammaproteobacteria bacterium]|nr:MAG: TIGR02449 family protein [Gammaproteobacteria bacterium]
MEPLKTTQLEEQLDTLLARFQELKDQNKQLRSAETSLLEERGKLLEKNELATSKIEAMINRLKDMEPKNG